MNFINILFLFVGGLSPTSNESRNGCVFGHWIVQNKGHEGNEKQIKFNKKKQYKTRVLSNKNESNTNNTSSF